MQRIGWYSRGKQVQAATVSGAITAVGQKIALEHQINPTKMPASDKLLPRISEMLAGWAKVDPPTSKKLPVESDVPELLSMVAMAGGATELTKSVGDNALIAFYFLLRIGEYSVKRTRNASKQTVQFKLEDVTFFERNAMDQLRQLPRNATDKRIMAAVSATLKLDNQKNGWKGVCVNQEANGEKHHCAVRALGRRYCYIRRLAKGNLKTKLSAYWENNKKCQLNDEDMRRNLKWAATQLDYPGTKGIPIELIDTHSLRCGGANALALSGYSDTQIQKMGRWRGATFKEYIREQLASYSEGMSKNMKRKFNFVNVAAGAFSDIVDVTSSVLVTDFNTTSAHAAAAC